MNFAHRIISPVIFVLLFAFSFSAKADEPTDAKDKAPPPVVDKYVFERDIILPLLKKADELGEVKAGEYVQWMRDGLFVTHADSEAEKIRTIRDLRKALRSFVISSEPLSDPHADLTVGERRKIYDKRFEALGSPSTFVVQVFQQLLMEIIAEQLFTAQEIAADYRNSKAILNSDNRGVKGRPTIRRSNAVVEPNFPERTLSLWKSSCLSALQGLKMLEYLPGGDEYPMGLEKANSVLFLMGAYRMHRKDLSTHLGQGACAGYVEDAWGRLITKYGDAENKTNPEYVNAFNMPELENPVAQALDTGIVYQYDDELFGLFRAKHRRKEYGSKVDHYQAKTRCGLVELTDGGVFNSLGDERPTYYHEFPRFHWADKVSAECALEKGNYRNSTDVTEAWGKRTERN